MWCDNCLLSHGAIAWNVFVAAYNLAGSIFLFRSGQFFFFNYPEWQIYGGIGMAVVAVCVISCIGLSNNTMLWSRVCFYLWPIILITVAVRDAFMMFQLDRQQGKIIWECNNGGLLWGQSAEKGYGSSTSTMPSGVCSAGFHSLYIAFVLSLLFDYAAQLYAYFMMWRFCQRLQRYDLISNSNKYYYG
ncbi:hypothetical protein OC861_001463 [Tilletia horrida]|nr:hypothetical protein OC861_001463 [Tilletia horrida]